MRPGTPGFVGARLREAREARGVTASSLADYLEVTRQAVSQYEHDIQSPSPEVMAKICQYLNLPEAFFLWRIQPVQKGTIFYRSLTSLTKAARIKAERRYEWMRMCIAYLREFINFPSVNIPTFNLPNNPQLIMNDKIERIAEGVRHSWKLGSGPINNIVRLLENNGVIVGRDAFDAEGLDAFSEWAPIENRPYIMLSADKQSAVRSRLDAAHELGHLLLHRHIDREKFTLQKDFKLMEEQAFRFAGAFLLPSESFAEEFYAVSLDTFVVMKRKWKVAIGMMIKRAENLELISREQARTLYVNRTRRGWRIREPLDDELEVEQPSLLNRAINLLVEEGGQSRDDISWKLPYAKSDLQSLFGISKRFWDEPLPPIKIMQARRSTPLSEQDTDASESKVIAFQKRKRE